MAKSNLRLLCFELKNGILFKWKRFVSLAAISFVFCIMLYIGVKDTAALHGENTVPSFTDYIIFLFKGIEEYHPELNKPFSVPVVWFVINFYIAMVIANYSANDICGFGRTVLLQNKSRKVWFFNKCVWAVASVAVCFIMIYLAPFIISIFTDSLTLYVSSGKAVTEQLELDCTFLPKGTLIVAAFLLPFLTSIAVSLIQVTLEFILKPIYSFMAVMCFWIISAYICFPIVFGNNSMIMRSRYFNEKGVAPMTGIIICLSVIIAAGILGMFYFKQYDIIDKG